MLDLTKIKEEYFKIKLPNGDILNLKKPTQSIIKYISDIETCDEQEQQEKVFNFVVRIINRNKEEKTYTTEQIDNMLDINLMITLVEEYVKFVQQIASNPN